MNRTLDDGLTVQYEHIPLKARVVVIATVKNYAGIIKVRGAAIRNPTDEFSVERGEQIALGRALAELDGTAQRRRDRRLLKTARDAIRSQGSQQEVSRGNASRGS